MVIDTDKVRCRNGNGPFVTSVYLLLYIPDKVRCRNGIGPIFDECLSVTVYPWQG